MLIERLTLQNFRAHEDLDLTFRQPRTLIVGTTGMGKSSIIDAIALALTGRCRGVDGKGSGQKDLITLQQNEARIHLELKGAPPIDRVLTQKGAASNPDPAGIQALLRTDDRVVTALCYGSTFFDMHRGDSQRLLLDLLNVQIEVPALDGKEPSAVGLAEVERLYDWWFAERTVRKKVAVSLQAATADKSWYRPEFEAVDVMGVWQDATEWVNTNRMNRAKLDDERTQLKIEVGRLESAAEQQKQIESFKAGASEARKKLTDHQLMLEQAILEQTTKKKAADDADAKFRKAEKEANRDGGSGVRMVALVNDIESKPKLGTGPGLPGVCVLSDGIPCSTEAKHFKGEVAKLKKQIADLKKRGEAVAVAQMDRSAAARALTQADQDVTYHQGQIEAYSTTIAKLDQLQVTAKADPKRLDATRSAIVALDTAIDVLDRALPPLQQKQAQAKAYSEIRHHMNQQLAELKKATLKVDEAERMVAALGPKGARATALARALAGFHTTINKHLEPFGFSLLISVDPSWQVLIRKGDARDYMRYDLLSKGERLCVGLAFQLALAKFSGLNFCVVDDVDGVTGEQLEALTSTVIHVDPTMQVIAARSGTWAYGADDVEGFQIVDLNPIDVDVEA